jgi:hypothetical protein
MLPEKALLFFIRKPPIGTAVNPIVPQSRT